MLSLGQSLGHAPLLSLPLYMVEVSVCWCDYLINAFYLLESTPPAQTLSVF